ncbi:MAG: helix-turn-helix domain-containing protein [Solirubrobacterales bacterium]
MSGVARQFGENLRRIRSKAGLSQERLGFLASLHRTEIGLLERGARVPRIDTLIKLASALGIEPEELIAGMEWTPGGAQAEPGGFNFSSQAARHTDLMERAAALREGQSEEVDAVELIRKSREELDERADRIDALLRGDED